MDGDWGPQTADAFHRYLSSVEPATLTPAPASWAAKAGSRYAWLNALPVETVPRTIWHAVQEIGVKEIVGSQHSATVLGYSAEVGLAKQVTNDEIPWCGAFAAAIAKRSGKAFPDQPLWALNWKKFGVEAGQPSLGDCTVFQREGGGHVAWYVAEDPTHYHVCGGNQSNAVSITRIEKERCVAVRRPIYNTQPASVKPYLVAASGAVSTNEA